MHATRFDRFSRVLSGVLLQPGLPRGRAQSLSRRRAVAAMALELLAFNGVERGAAGGPGCKNVGKTCRRSTQCCSGICRGGKTKRCRPHDSRGCRAGLRQERCGGPDAPCTTSSGEPGVCNTTTGKAGYCAFDVDCFPCRQDADCRPHCGPKAACVTCADCADAGGTACAGTEIPGCTIF